MNPTYQVRKATCEDVNRLAQVSADSLDLPWREKDFSDAITGAQSMVYVAADGEGAFGYVVLYYAADEGEIPSIAVDIDHRRLGAAKQLLEAAFADAASRGVRKVFLEVRESNAPAVSLYEQMGFLHVGTRKNFYTNPTENACIMMCFIG